MKTNKAISIIFLILTCACHSKRNKNNTPQQPDLPIKINLIEAMAKPKDIKLSDIADSIEYIPLEYMEDNPVGVISGFKYFPNNIFIHVGGSDGGFLRFDGKGKFLNKIGTIGRGPGEYMSGSRFSVIDNPERFYILCNFVPRNLLEYDYNGNFWGTVLTANPSDGDFEAVSSQRFLFLASNIRRADTSIHYMACLKDRSNKSVTNIDHPFFSNRDLNNLGQFSYGGAGSGAYFDKWPLFYDENSMDTIYSIKNDSLYPKYILDKGSEGAPLDKLYCISNPPERYKYLSPISTSFKETPTDVFFMAIYKEELLYLINYNKKLRSVSSMKTPYVIPNLEQIKQPATVYPKFENDIDGGLSFASGFPNREGDIWTYKYDAAYLKKMLTKEHFENSKALYPEEKKSLMQLVDSIKDFDNPIIMVVYLKKN